jgi:hypothetical protein
MAGKDEQRVRPTPGESARGNVAAALGVALGAVAGAGLAVVLRVIAAVAHGTFGHGEPEGHGATGAGENTIRRPKVVEHVPEPLRPGWNRPPPEHLVGPSYWPVALALGISFLFWGLVSSWIISAIGALITIVSLANWIAELRHDARPRPH